MPSLVGLLLRPQERGQAQRRLALTSPSRSEGPHAGAEPCRAGLVSFGQFSSSCFIKQ